MVVALRHLYQYGTCKKGISCLSGLDHHPSEASFGQGFVTQINVKILIDTQNGCLSCCQGKEILN
jgi:hypothetical protein